MDFSFNNAKAVRVWSDDNNLWLLLVDGRQLSIPIVCFPRLKNATSEQILNYNLSGGGLGVHWDELDEDLYVPNLLLGITSIPDRCVCQYKNGENDSLNFHSLIEIQEFMFCSKNK